MEFSCIIPAYNEWPRIGKVLETVLACPELSEIVVVDDGSTDTTWNVISTFEDPRLRKIQLEKNGGKTCAVFTGIRASTGTHLVFIDSDLIGLKPEHITALITPVRNKESDVSFSIRTNSLPIYHLLGVDFVTGERVVPRTILEDESYYIDGPGFGLEGKMNKKILDAHLTMKTVSLPIITPRKSVKMWWLRGTLADQKMTYDIVKILGIREIIRQNRLFSNMQKWMR